LLDEAEGAKIMSDHSAVGIAKIGQIAINVHDLDKAIAFYRDVLELPFLFTTSGLAFFQCGEVRLMLSRPEQPAFDHPGSVIYYQVADIQRAYATLRERSVEFIDEPHLIAKMPDHDLWMVFFHDLDGNTLALMCEIKSS
jgi:methylmalonyl-CoA/ethylmalonyl-CoA epimerase